MRVKMDSRLKRAGMTAFLCIHPGLFTIRRGDPMEAVEKGAVVEKTVQAP